MTETFAQVSGDNQFWALNLSARRWTLADREGTNGLPFQTANDPRVPWCAGAAAECRPVQPSFTNRSFDGSTPFYAWLGLAIRTGHAARGSSPPRAPVRPQLGGGLPDRYLHAGRRRHLRHRRQPASAAVGGAQSELHGLHEPQRVTGAPRVGRA